MGLFDDAQTTDDQPTTRQPTAAEKTYNSSDVQWDDHGPYRMDRYTGKKSYVSPAEILPVLSAGYTVDPKLAAWAQGNGKPTGGVIHSQGQWNPNTGKWEQPINWGNLASIGIASAMTAGLANAAMAGGGGATAIGGGAASTALPATTTVGATGALATGVPTLGATGTGLAALPATATVGSTGALATGAPSLGGNMGWESYLLDLAKSEGKSAVTDYVKGKMADGQQQDTSSSGSLADLAHVLGGAATGAASGRLQQALLELQRAHEEGSRFGQQSANASDQAKFGLTSPNIRANQAVRGDILANSQDVNIQAPDGIKMGTVTGGLRPSLLSPETRQFGRNLTRNALASQMNGGDKIAFPDLPAMPEMPQASGLDKAMGYGSTAAGLTSALLGSNAGKYANMLAGLFGDKNKNAGVDPNQFVGPVDSGNMTGNLFGQNAGDYGIGQSQDPQQAYQDWLKDHPGESELA